MAKTIWQVNMGGTEASVDGKTFRDKTISGFTGDPLPASARFSRIAFTICLSVGSPAGSTSRIYYVSALNWDGSTIVFADGNPAITSTQSVWNNHGYWDGKNGVGGYLTSNLQWFAGRSPDNTVIYTKAGNVGKTGSIAYIRGVQLIFEYETFTPTLVQAGQPILTSDYNQIRNMYSSLGAVSAGGLIDDANITAIRSYDTDVVVPGVGTLVSAANFNANVLNKI